MKRFRNIALGGTFDILHKGHEKILLQAFQVAEQVWIGLAADSLVRTIDKGHKINSYMYRLAVLERFLSEKGLLGRARIIPIRSRFGVAHLSFELDAILVSKEKWKVAVEINKTRRRCGLRRLNVVVFDKMTAEDGEPISSSRIRAGDIDLKGAVLKSR